MGGDEALNGMLQLFFEIAQREFPHFASKVMIGD
jgi:hypothetical protein